jgi:hypothetical protein
MTDQDRGVASDRCPWCSSDKGADAQGRCLACGAALVPEPVSKPVPGVTDVDALGLLRPRGTNQPNRIVAWVTGTSGESETWTPAGEALEKPSLEVQREMLRLQIEAAIAAQQAEVDALRADETLAAAKGPDGAMTVETDGPKVDEAEASETADAEDATETDDAPTEASDPADPPADVSGG